MGKDAKHPHLFVLKILLEGRFFVLKILLESDRFFVLKILLEGEVWST